MFVEKLEARLLLAAQQVTAVVDDQAFLDDIADGESWRTMLDLPILVNVPQQLASRDTVYDYKIGESDEVNCRHPQGYFPWRDSSENLEYSLADYADNTNIKLCLRGRVSPGPVQPPSEATIYEWTKVIPPPEAFNIFDPAGLISDSKPTVQWEAATNADIYDVVVATDSLCTSAVESFFDLTTTSVEVSELADGSYFTCVEARNSTGTTVATNNGLGFTVDTTPPGEFAIIDPSGLVNTGTPGVTWEMAADATSYDLVISTLADCGDTVQEATDLITTSYRATTLADGTYYTCVVASDEVGNTTDATNNGLSFEVDTTPPEAFAILGPSGTINVSTPDVTWEAAVGASRYDLVVSTASDCSVVTQEALGLTGTSYTLEELAENTYYACVTAEDEAGNTTAATNSGLAFTYIVAPEIHLEKFTRVDINPIDIEKLVRVAAPSIVGDVCDVLGKPVSITFEYDPGTTADTDQGLGKAEVLFDSGAVDDDGVSFIIVTDESTADDVLAGVGRRFFAGNVDINAKFEANEDIDSFGSQIFIHFYDDTNGGLLQSIVYHTSCSQPIQLGDVIGNATLVGYVGETGSVAEDDLGPGIDDDDADAPTGPSASPGDTVVFTYVVTNPIENTALADVDGDRPVAGAE